MKPIEWSYGTGRHFVIHDESTVFPRAGEHALDDNAVSIVNSCPADDFKRTHSIGETKLETRSTLLIGD